MATYSQVFKHIGRQKAAAYRQRRLGRMLRVTAPLTPEEEERLRWYYWEQEQAALDEDAQQHD